MGSATLDACLQVGAVGPGDLAQRLFAKGWQYVVRQSAIDSSECLLGATVLDLLFKPQIGGSESVRLCRIPGRLAVCFAGDGINAASVQPLCILRFVPGLFGGNVRIGTKAVPSPFTIGLLESQFPALPAGAANHEIEPINSIIFAVFLFLWFQGSQHRIGQWPALDFGSLHGGFCMVWFEQFCTIYPAIHGIKGSGGMAGNRRDWLGMVLSQCFRGCGVLREGMG